MIIYIALIQICLFLISAVVVWCEVSPLFADSLWSNCFRWCLGISLTVLGYYAHFLIVAPYFVVFAILIVVFSFTFLSLKMIVNERYKRARKTQNHNKLKENN